MDNNDIETQIETIRLNIYEEIKDYDCNETNAYFDKNTEQIIKKYNLKIVDDISLS